jgi:hypothetical protein
MAVPCHFDHREKSAEGLSLFDITKRSLRQISHPRRARNDKVESLL